MALNKEQQAAVRDAAFVRGIPAAFALGIVDKESAGKALYAVQNAQVPAIRYEGHYLYRLLKDYPKVQAAAVKLGYASPHAGGVKNPGNMAARYTMLNRIKDWLDDQSYALGMLRMAARDLAYQSISMGIGQVMGSHHKLLGFGTAAHMFSDAHSFAGQVEQFLEFIYIDKAGLKYAQDYNYKAFGKFYNGKNAPASYWIELEGFVSLYMTEDEAHIPNYAMERIKKLGFENVMAFQSSRGIKVDGIIGKITTEQIAAAEQERAVASAPAVSPTKIVTGAVAAGAGTVLAANPQAAADGTALIVPMIEPIMKGITTLAPLGLPFVLVAVGVVIAVVVFNAVRKK